MLTAEILGKSVDEAARLNGERLAALEKALLVEREEKRLWKDRFQAVQLRVQDIFGIAMLPTAAAMAGEESEEQQQQEPEEEDSTAVSGPPAAKKLCRPAARFTNAFVCPDCPGVRFPAGELVSLYGAHRKRAHPKPAK